MRLLLHQSEYFWADLAKQVDWYREYGTPEVAVRFVNAAEKTLNELTKNPGLGRL